MALTLSSVSAREWLQKRREGVKPWSEFISTSSFSIPKSVAPLPKRIVSNIERFQSNYLFVFIVLVAFCILTSPLLLVAIAACLGACYIISVKNAAKKVVIMGKELNVAHQYTAVGILSFPLFWLAGAGSAVFWVIGASFFVIMLHASLYSGRQEQEGFDLEMETV
ncbi:prenylated Rab acceptor protein 1-like isoform X2 [Liolophura sinensis]